MQLSVKNTFIEVLDEQEQAQSSLRRSFSEGDLMDSSRPGSPQQHKESFDLAALPSVSMKKIHSMSTTAETMSESSSRSASVGEVKDKQLPEKDAEVWSTCTELDYQDKQLPEKDAEVSSTCTELDYQDRELSDKEVAMQSSQDGKNTKVGMSMQEQQQRYQQNMMQQMMTPSNLQSWGYAAYDAQMGSPQQVFGVMMPRFYQSQSAPQSPAQRPQQSPQQSPMMRPMQPPQLRKQAFSAAARNGTSNTSPKFQNSAAWFKQTFVQKMHMETGLPIEQLQELDNKGVLAKIPRDDQGKLSSVGSLKHSAGGCSPCVYFSSRGSCNMGIKCGYCHLQHEGEKEKPQKMKQRMRQAQRGKGSDNRGEYSGASGDRSW
eukprot:TRINITY_DN2281_c0_g1_i1.p1 TRINITY_DN2281_c0_g1~~TRINITY_DN2281_c0_g1_i1.p1  ORF type:complete len:407 (+),score=112.92 TRINITY_DN2281_c0_g1_i1:98-1222(+)